MGEDCDKDGTKTLALLHAVDKIVTRITGTHPASVGVHPVIYFYSRGGSFQPSAFLATAVFLQKLEQRNKLKNFIEVRADFEDFLVDHKEFIGQFLHRFGSGHRSVTPILNLYQRIMDLLINGQKNTTLLESLKRDEEFKFLTPASQESSNVINDTKAGKYFSKKVKTAAYFREALMGVVKCPICRAATHRNSIQIDHVVRIREGGRATVGNAAPCHPYCNSTHKG